jgi:hypothetical protein
MSSLSRDDYIELGISIRSDRLVPWANRQVGAARGHEARLKSRGVDAAFLASIQDVMAAIEKAGKELGEASDLPPEAAALAVLLREEASSFWREAKLIAKAAFGTDPDVLARFRTGVQTGLLLANLTKELESTTALLREHAAQLAGLGGTEGFIGRGERLVKRLKEAKGNLDAACRSLSPAHARRCHDKGLLYDLIRKLVRTGQLEFMGDPKQAAAFNFTGVRPKGVSVEPRLKDEAAGVRQSD